MLTFPAAGEDNDNEVPPLKGLSFLDRFLVVWIFLAMAIGIILGALVPDASSTLEKGKFVGVSLPIGMSLSFIYSLVTFLAIISFAD